jgi:hypothetical protein
MRLNEHPLRRQVVGEMHLRRWPAIHAPAQIVQVLRLVTPEERAAHRAMLDNWLGQSENPRHAEGELAPGISFVWEQHSEACGITLFMQEPHADPSEAVAWIERFPGQTMRATRIHVVENQAQARDMLPQMGFVGSDLISCLIGASGVRLWSDFRMGTKVWALHWWRAMGGTRRSCAIAAAVSGIGQLSQSGADGPAGGAGCWPRLDAAEATLRNWPPMSPILKRPTMRCSNASVLSLDLMSLSTETITG